MVLVVLAGLIWSMGGVLVRGTQGLDAWDYLGWRSAGLIVCMGLAYPAGPRALLRAVRRQGPMGWGAAFSLALSSLAISFALKHTTVAFATFLASIAPLLAVIIMATVYRERISAGAIGCVVLGLAGIAIMVRGDFSGGQLAGNIAAALSALGFASYSVLVNRNRGGDWFPAVWTHGWICLALCAVAIATIGRGTVPLSPEIVLPIVHGGGIIAFGLLLYNRAARRVAPFTLIVTAQAETVFAPVWGFLVLGEVPGLSTVAGGFVIILAVVAAGLMSARDTAPLALPPLAGDAAPPRPNRSDDDAPV
ncbi:DMT family transporter [Ensifer soli]|uniref:DMT family transporter n=1 Tax=Ciceribacter sp. sgz301302 TaxID=3342379 RepID=UPI0035B9E1B7